MFTRKANRLNQKYLYSSNNWYFITICVEQKSNILGELLDAKIQLNELGKIVEAEWFNLPSIFTNLELKDFVIMPNHFHFILELRSPVVQKNIEKNCYLGDIISRLKNNSRKKIVEFVEAGLSRQITSKENKSFLKTLNNGETGSPLQTKNEKIKIENIFPYLKNFNYHKIWQKSFYDHVIRDEKDLRRIQEYIQFNHLNWHLDELNPDNKTTLKFTP
jgi:REP element-mobilizing transposase RayT